MKAFDYDAVAYDAAIYCVGCLPEGVDVNDEGVHPVFADSEWDSYPCCDVCHAEHDYVNLTEDGQNWLREREHNKMVEHETGSTARMNTETCQIYSLYMHSEYGLQDLMDDLFIDETVHHISDLSNKMRDLVCDWLMERVNIEDWFIRDRMRDFLEATLLDVQWDLIYEYVYGKTYKGARDV